MRQNFSLFEVPFLYLSASSGTLLALYACWPLPAEVWGRPIFAGLKRSSISTSILNAMENHPLNTSLPKSLIDKSHREKLAGKTIVIIGASSGLGRGTALQLGLCRANVVLAARRTDLLEEVARQVQTAGGNPLVVTTDISNPEDIERLAEAAQRQFGAIDIWINNTGVGALGHFWEIPLHIHARIIDVNLKGVIYGSHAAMRLFRTQGHGVLINTGSIDSEVPMAYQSSYAASKAAVRSLTEILHQELRLAREERIRVVTIMPWAIDTPWWRHAANYTGGTPRMGGMDAPEKVVKAIVMACLQRRRARPVGWKATASYISHHLFPHFTEWFSAQMYHRYQYKTAPPAPYTTGAVLMPMKNGRGIDDGVRARMKAEDHQRQAQNQPLVQKPTK